MALLGLVFAGQARGHDASHPYESVIEGISPAAAARGIEVRMLDYDSQVELTNRSGRRVVITGYEGEPYARIDADGGVYLNRRSPSLPLSADRLGRGPATGKGDASAPPEWSRIGSDGRLAWFDRRSHIRKDGVPPQVEDTSERSLIWDYRIPIEVGGSPAEIKGSLFWNGKDKFPTGLFVGLLIATGLCALFGAWALKRMR